MEGGFSFGIVALLSLLIVAALFSLGHESQMVARDNFGHGNPVNYSVHYDAGGSVVYDIDGRPTDHPVHYDAGGNVVRYRYGHGNPINYTPMINADGSVVYDGNGTPKPAASKS